MIYWFGAKGSPRSSREISAVFIPLRDFLEVARCGMCEMERVGSSLEKSDS